MGVPRVQTHNQMAKLIDVSYLMPGYLSSLQEETIPGFTDHYDESTQNWECLKTRRPGRSGHLFHGPLPGTGQLHPDLPVRPLIGRHVDNRCEACAEA